MDKHGLQELFFDPCQLDRELLIDRTAFGFDATAAGFDECVGDQFCRGARPDRRQERRQLCAE